jgi:hypothetical protein
MRRRYAAGRRAGAASGAGGRGTGDFTPISGPASRSVTSYDPTLGMITSPMEAVTSRGKPGPLSCRHASCGSRIPSASSRVRQWLMARTVSPVSTSS